MLSFQEAQKLRPDELRRAIRKREWEGATARLVLGYVQANLVILPKDIAFEFTAFCIRNPQACPILEITRPGSPYITRMADKADLRTDLPRYKVYKNGQLIAEPNDISEYWRDDFVGFLIGCSATLNRSLLEASIPLRAMENMTVDPMYISNIECVPYDQFHGPTVVSMRPIPYDKVVKAVQVTTRFREAHGAPIHIGDPAVIGIKDLNKVDWGYPLQIRPGDVPVFWACGVTPQAVAMNCKPEMMITHMAGHLFVCDRKDTEIAIF